jgi:hypothetical protein
VTVLAQSPTTLAPVAGESVCGEPVHIVTWRLLDYDGSGLTYGGLQRWLLALIEILRHRGHPVVVHQRAHAVFQKELEPGVTIRGYCAPMGAHGTPLFNLRVSRGTNELFRYI